MPTPLSITAPTLTNLKIATTDAIKFQLLLDKVPGNPAQIVNLATFAAAYGVTDDQVSRTIASLETAKALKTTYGMFTLNWTSNPTTTATAAQIQADWNNRILDDATYYVYQALVLTKGGGMTQQIDPATYAAPPWNIPQATLIAEVQALSNRRPTGATSTAPTPFTVDFGDVTLTWLADNLGNAA